MGRPGFVHLVDERTPPLAVPFGDTFRLEPLPVGSSVVFAPDPLPAVQDLPAAIAAASAAPLDSEPLAALLSPGMRLTVALDDNTVPWPRMRPPDVRSRVVEHVLTLAAEAGVDDVVLVVGNGLNRKLTREELQRLVGERVFRSFYADGGLVCHDALQAADEHPGAGPGINARAGESDLLVYVHVVVDDRVQGPDAVLEGLGSASTFARRKGWTADPRAVRLPEGLRVFQIDAVLDNASFPKPLEFLGRREWEWRIKDRMNSSLLWTALDVAPPRVRRRMVQVTTGAFGVTGVYAGDPVAVGRRSVEQVSAQLRVPVPAQADVLVLGVGAQNPYTVDSTLNPVLAAWSALGLTFAAHTGRPAVREGGAVIVYAPLEPEFDSLRHPSYVDFFASVLSERPSAPRIAEEFEAKYAEDAWYAHLYESSTAFAGVHPCYLWYEVARTLDYVGDVVFVGAHTPTAERMGFRTATTLHDALEIVAATVGRSPAVTYLHSPPALVCDLS